MASDGTPIDTNEPPPERRLGKRFELAFSLAREWHAAQTRKGTDIPYVGHLMHVSAHVIEAAGTEDQAIAALLHDALEDAGDMAAYRARRERIASEFGERVLALVEGCTDGSPDEKDEMAWRDRKERYLAHLAEADERLLVVSLADKLHNAGQLLYDAPRHGPDFFDRFHATPAETAWYYRSLADVFARRLSPGTPGGRMAAELGRLVYLLERELAEGG